jgi:hypothetical protein
MFEEVTTSHPLHCSHLIYHLNYGNDLEPISLYQPLASRGHSHHSSPSVSSDFCISVRVFIWWSKDLMWTGSATFFISYPTNVQLLIQAHWGPCWSLNTPGISSPSHIHIHTPRCVCRLVPLAGILLPKKIWWANLLPLYTLLKCYFLNEAYMYKFANPHLLLQILFPLIYFIR